MKQFLNPPGDGFFRQRACAEMRNVTLFLLRMRKIYRKKIIAAQYGDDFFIYLFIHLFFY